MARHNLLALMSVVIEVSFLACSVFAQSNRPPSVVVVRDLEPDLAGGIDGDQAILLDSHANDRGVISGLGVSGAIANQNRVLIDTVHERVVLIENLRDRLSTFAFDGTPQLTVPLEGAASVVLTDDATRIGCVAGRTLDERQTVFFDATTGKEVRRFNWGGVALVNDTAGSQLWSVGRQLIAFSPDGEIRIRRPLSRLPAEPDYPTVINSRNWCGVGVVIEPNQNSWWRNIWIIERDHPDVGGSRNRLFAVDEDGQTRILVELQEIDPISIACATYQGDLHRIVVVDGATGDLVSFDTDGKLMGRHGSGAGLIAFGENSGLWVAGRKSVARLDPGDLTVIAEHSFEIEADPVGLAVH